jgi:hypothetical protein
VKQPIPKNIIVSDWDPSSWKSMPPQDAIHALFSFANSEAKNVTVWYQKAKRGKAMSSRLLRGLAIVLFVLGGLAPIVAGFLHGDNTGDRMVAINQGGYLMLGVAAGLLAFDRYFGVSSGWIRYMTSLAGIERLRSEFMLDWTVMLQKAPTIDASAVLPFLERAETFQKAVLEIVEKETAAWVVEFQSSVADLDKVVQAQKQAADANVQAALKQEAEVRDRLKREDQAAAVDRQPGAINLEIEGDIEGTMQILLDGTEVKQTTARATALTNLAKGQHAIEVRGVKGGKPVSASKVVSIEPGKTVDLKLAPH